MHLYKFILSIISSFNEQNAPYQSQFSLSSLRVGNFLRLVIFWNERINLGRFHHARILLSNLVCVVGSILGCKLVLLDMGKTASFGMNVLYLA